MRCQLVMKCGESLTAIASLAWTIVELCIEFPSVQTISQLFPDCLLLNHTLFQFHSRQGINQSCTGRSANSGVVIVFLLSLDIIWLFGFITYAVYLCIRLRVWCPNSDTLPQLKSDDSRQLDSEWCSWEFRLWVISLLKSCGKGK